MLRCSYLVGRHCICFLCKLAYINFAYKNFVVSKCTFIQYIHTCTHIYIHVCMEYAFIYNCNLFGFTSVRPLDLDCIYANYMKFVLVLGYGRYL